MCLTKHHAMKTYWFLISALEGGGQFHAPAALPPGKEHPVPIGQEAGRAA
jgi:hypothetical protein